jgi:hypothetical protein
MKSYTKEIEEINKEAKAMDNDTPLYGYDFSKNSVSVRMKNNDDYYRTFKITKEEMQEIFDMECRVNPIIKAIAEA